MFKVECPTGSGDYMNLVGVAEEIQHRVIHIFGRDIDGRRATNGGNPKLDFDPHFRDYVWFYEVRCLQVLRVRVIRSYALRTTQFFHGDDGRGLGASHQTGWSGLVAYHILQSGANCRLPKTPKSEFSISHCCFRCLILVITLSTAPRSLARHYFDVSLSA
jgi:hypothetical protein